MKLFRVLRSRRLAVWLLVALTGYAWLTTFVPLESVDPQVAARWDAAHPLGAAIADALGLHNAYGNPLFIIAATVLMLSTAACAWERTRDGIREWRSRGQLSPATVTRLNEAPTFSLRASSPSTPEALDSVQEALASLGMRVRGGQRVVEGRGHSVGLMGSPLFHLALTSLFLFVALGQLTRHEGFVNIPVGGSIRDEPGSYDVALSEGPLGGAGFTGLRISVDDIETDFEAGGIDRGPTPLVSLRDGDRVVARTRVYPNQPLVHGSTVIHRREVGPAFLATVSTDDGRSAEKVTLYFRNSDLTSQQFGVFDSTEGTVTVIVAPAGGGRVAVTAGSRPASVVGTGGTVAVSKGTTLTVDALSGYAQLKVVRDWTVPWIYGSFLLGIVGVSLAVFAPPRAVMVLVRESDAGGCELRVLVTARRSDPEFAGRVHERLDVAASQLVGEDLKA